MDETNSSNVMQHDNGDVVAIHRTITNDDVNADPSKICTAQDVKIDNEKPSPAGKANAKRKKKIVLAEAINNDVDTVSNNADVDALIKCRPVKRARTAYFIFTDEKRPDVQKAHPGESVAVAARVLGQIWSSMTSEEKLVYQSRAAEERERVAADVKAWEEQYASVTGVNWVTADNSPKDDTTNLVYPAARIRKICKLDPDVRGLSKEALLTITKAAELFTAAIGRECVLVAQIQNRRKLLPDDLVQVCNSRERLEFLRDDIKDLTKLQHKDAEIAAASKKVSQTTKLPLTSTNQTKTITSYFSTISTSKSVPEAGIAD